MMMMRNLLLVVMMTMTMSSLNLFSKTQSVVAVSHLNPSVSLFFVIKKLTLLCCFVVLLKDCDETDAELGDSAMETALTKLKNTTMDASLLIFPMVKELIEDRVKDYSADGFKVQQFHLGGNPKQQFTDLITLVKQKDFSYVIRACGFFFLCTAYYFND